MEQNSQTVHGKEEHLGVTKTQGILISAWMECEPEPVSLNLSAFGLSLHRKLVHTLWLNKDKAKLNEIEHKKGIIE